MSTAWGIPMGLIFIMAMVGAIGVPILIIALVQTWQLIEELQSAVEDRFDGWGL